MISTNRNILLIDNNDSFTYNLVQVFEELGCVVDIFGNALQPIDLLSNYDRIVFSPGPGLPAEFPLMFDILNYAKKETQILGICLGHQAIAQFFGAKLYKQDTVQHGQRKRILNVCEDKRSALYNMPISFEAGLYHSWAVEINSLPNDLSVSCLSEDGIIMGICHTTLPIEGIQFHPESFLTYFGPRLLKNWLAL